MTKRPLPLTIIGWLFIAVGAISFVSGWLPRDNGGIRRALELRASHPLDTALADGVRILAAVAGVFILRGINWARWLLVAWLLFHVAISLRHSPSELIIHSLLCVVVLYFLSRADAAEYFRARGTEAEK